MLEEASGTGQGRSVDGDEEEDDLFEIVNHLKQTLNFGGRNEFKKPIEKRFVAEMHRLRGQKQATLEMAKHAAAQEVAARMGSPTPRPGRSRIRTRKQGGSTRSPQRATGQNR